MNHVGYVKCLEKLVKVLKIILTWTSKPLLKEASVLTNPSLWKICQRKDCYLNGACKTTLRQKILPVKVSLFVTQCVKA